jgi:hypothetical protein
MQSTSIEYDLLGQEQLCRPGGATEMRSELTFSGCLFSPETVVLSMPGPELRIQHWFLTRYDSTSQRTLLRLRFSLTPFTRL